VKDAELRVKIVEERGMFDANPKAFRVNYDVTQKELRDQIDNARAILPNVKVPHDLRVKISQVCSELDVDGLRGDIVSNRAAKALVAFRGRAEVTPEDVGTVMPNCLRHRLRKDPLESIDSGTLVIDKFNEIFGYSS
jgi:magnesium chelatase subunit I